MTKKIAWQLGLLIVAALSLVVPISAQQSQSPGATSGQMAAIRKRGVLHVGMAMFVPWAMHNNKGELIGFEVDVAKQLAETLGVEVKFFPVPQSELIPDLDKGRYDIIVSGLYVTPARAIFANFSDEYARSNVTLLANRKLAANLQTVADYNKETVKIGVTTGTLYLEIAKRNFPRAKFQEFSDEAEAMEAVTTGELHAAVAATPRPEIDALRFPDKVFLPRAQPLSSQGEAFAVRKGDLDFVNFLNSWIKYYEQNGWLEERRTFWFKTLNWANDL